MKRRLLKVLVLVVGVGALGVISWKLGLRDVAMTWGTIGDEASRPLPGDALIPTAQRMTTRAIFIPAPPEAVFPWVSQLGAGRAAFYSHVWLERAIGCDLTNGDALVPAWQLAVGDLVRLCPEGSGPPIAYVVKELSPPQALVLAVEEHGMAATTWTFTVAPVPGGTRLISRNRTGVAQGWQELIEPGVFLMETGMLRGIRDRATRAPP
jgi:hypothetical protein